MIGVKIGPLDHMSCLTNVGLGRFSCLDVYWIQTDKKSDEQNIYIENSGIGGRLLD